MITSITGREIHSGSMYSGYTHSRSVSATPVGPQPLAHLDGDGNGCSGEMWSPFALSPPRSVAPARTSSTHQSDRFGGTWIPTSGSSRRASATSRFMSSIVTSHAHVGRVAAAGPSHTPVRQYSRVACVGDLRRLAAVVALVRDEVLEDHLLDVTVALVQLGELLERRDPLVLGLADPDQDPARERDPQLAGGRDRLDPPRRVLGRRARVDGLHQPLG